MLFRIGTEILGNLSCESRQIHLIEIYGSCIFIKLGKLYNIADQRKQSAGFLMDFSGKALNILGCGNTAFNYLGVA